MPIVTMKLWEEALDEPKEAELIGALTDAVASVLGSEIRQYTTVLIEPVAQRRWGIAGAQSGDSA